MSSSTIRGISAVALVDIVEDRKRLSRLMAFPRNLQISAEAISRRYARDDVGNRPQWVFPYRIELNDWAVRFSQHAD